MKKAIVFDFGMVLIDWSPYNLYRKLLPSDEAIREFLEEIKFSEFNSKLDAGYPFAQISEEVYLKYPHRRELTEAFFTRWTECSGEAMPDTVAIMRELKKSGYPVYGLSNWSVESFSWVKDRYDFLQELDDYLLSGMVGQAKPGEEIFHTFLDRIGRKAEDCVFIDDAPANIETAKKLGFTGILFKSAEQLRSDLQGIAIL